MRDVLEILASFVFTTGALFALVLRDEGRLSPEQRARSWPVSSRNAALVVFGVVALPIHYARTRRSVLGLLGGLALAFVVSVVNSLLVGTIDWFMGGPGLS